MTVLHLSCGLIYTFSKLKYLKMLKMKSLIYTTAFTKLHNGSISYKKQSISDWEEAVAEAKNVLGFSPSFLNLGLLKSNENIASSYNHLRSPLNKNKSHLWGLIVLLFSKMAGNINVEHNNEEYAGVLDSQRVLAQVTEMVYTGHILHKRILNPNNTSGNESSVNKYDNEIAVLYGLHLFAKATKELALLRNLKVYEMMCMGLRDMCQSEFIGRRDQQNFSLPSRGIKAKEEWTRQNVLSVGNFLGLCCKSALHLAGHESEWQERGFQFGTHVALAFQAQLDFKPFIGNYCKPYTPFSLTSAPVLFHLEYDTSLFDEIEKGSESVGKVDYNKIHKCVSKGPGLCLTKQLQQHHTCKAEEILDTFEENKAGDVLKNIINSMGNL